MAAAAGCRQSKIFYTSLLCPLGKYTNPSPSESQTARDSFFIHFSRLPLKALQIDVHGVFQQHALLLQQDSLFRPMGSQPACVVHHPMAGITPIQLRMGQNPRHQTGILLPSDQPCNLAVRGDRARRNLLHCGQHFIGDRILGGSFSSLRVQRLTGTLPSSSCRRGAAACQASSWPQDNAPSGWSLPC